MSFLDDLFDAGKSVLSWIGGDSVSANVVKTAATAFTLYKLNDNVNKQSTPPTTSVSEDTFSSSPPGPVNIDRGVRLQVYPNPEHSIPVVYGDAWLGGIVTDAEITANNTVMYYVLTICERTGVKFSDNIQSQITFEEILINDQKVVFSSGGQLVNYTMDREGNVDSSLAGLVEIRLFNNGSTGSTLPAGYSGGSSQAAYDFIPSWTSTDTMNNLVFAAVKVTYSSDKGVTSLPNILFKLSNTMTMPGDCIFDYMTNTRYGAGIPESEIFRS